MQILLKRSALLICVLTLFISRVQAELIVVADNGGESAAIYYDELGLTALTINEPTDNQNTPMLAPVTIAQMLPISSLKLTPGKVQTKQIQAYGVSPFFIMGSDALSKRWLVERKNELIKLGAKGLVVNVQTKEELEALQALAPELLLQPTYGDDIAERLDLVHYPVLITSSIITQ